MGKKVLIVDDEKAIVDILNHNLKREGYETFEAYDGEEAINLVKSENPDLVLLDVMLPRVDGLSVTYPLEELNEAVKATLSNEIMKAFIKL